MLFLWLTFLGNGGLMISLPFINNFAGMVCVRCLQNICLGAYITADTSLVVYTMGPVKSRCSNFFKILTFLFVLYSHDSRPQFFFFFLKVAFKKQQCVALFAWIFSPRSFMFQTLYICFTFLDRRWISGSNIFGETIFAPR